MRLAVKTACLFFMLIFIAPLYADPDDEELPIGDEEDEVFFLEELFIFEETLSFDEFLLDEEESLAEETPSEDEEAFPSDEPLLSEENHFDEENPDEEALLSEDMLAEEDLLAGFVFEAPPLIFEDTPFEIRSIDAIFPDLSYGQKIALSNDGIRYYFLATESPQLIPHADSGLDLLGSVMKKNPSHLIEALVLVPYNEKELDLLDIYNALGRIEKIKDQPFFYKDNDFYIFTESTRIVNTRNRRAVADPAPAVRLPFSETMYLRLKEFSFGNVFIRNDIDISAYGLTYRLTNFTDVRYFLVPIMKAERFTSIIYLEPVKEGTLIYSVSGFYLPGFIADKRNLTPNINIRISVLLDWIVAGLKTQQETAPEPQPNE